MTASHDIFHVESGGVRWLECASSLEEAEARVLQIAAGIVGDYVIVNQLTGNRVFLKFDGASSDSHGSADTLSKGKGN